MLKLLDSKEPLDRSAAAQLLPLTPQTTKKLLQKVSQEEKLYCRLEMMHKLESGGQTTAQMMLPYLAKIGHNQHTVPLSKPSAKKSFPLPRDLIARSLGNMSPVILPYLFTQLVDLPQPALSELIDAIGLLLFSHPDVVEKQHFDQLKHLWATTKKPLIHLFFCPDAKRQLLETITASMPDLAAEAQHSLRILAKGEFKNDDYGTNQTAYGAFTSLW